MAKIRTNRCAILQYCNNCFVQSAVICCKCVVYGVLYGLWTSGFLWAKLPKMSQKVVFHARA